MTAKIHKIEDNLRDYVERTRKETSWFKVFLPIFAGMTIMVELFTPVVLYIVQVVVKHKEWIAPDPWIGLLVCIVYSAFMAWVITDKRRKALEEKG